MTAFDGAIAGAAFGFVVGLLVAASEAIEVTGVFAEVKKLPPVS